MHPRVLEVTERLIARSRGARAAYLAQMAVARETAPVRRQLPCANYAHAVAACGHADKQRLSLPDAANVAIVTAYNDMLSAHQPYEDYPQQIKQALAAIGSVGQVAGGVPAMCDGVTQGQAGMELSLASREVIAMSTAIALSHNVFDAALLLGVCDKIVPGLLIGALRFGHLPTVLIPAGPMASGLPNAQKAALREQFARGEVGRDALLAAEMQAYHSAGTCTFYGTANTNQLLMEVMGLHLPGASFVHPQSTLRQALTQEAVKQVVKLTAQGGHYTPLAEIVDERCLINAVVALHASGGSTNHSLHLPAIARAAGIELTWQDMADLSQVVPSLMRVYPNGQADINQFHGAGGTAYLIGQLLDAGLLHENVKTVVGQGLNAYRQEPWLDAQTLRWRAGVCESLNLDILRPVDQPFSAQGGLRVLSGNLGRAVIKTSAVAEEHLSIEAPAKVFEDQAQLQAAFEAGQLSGDFVAVVRFQGPRANGMPELHKLTPLLAVLQGRGQRVALVTDGRMSGASGKVPAAIHLTPEASCGGWLARVQEGDLIRLDGTSGKLELLLSDDEINARIPAPTPAPALGSGRELFAFMRASFSSAESGASVFAEQLGARSC